MEKKVITNQREFKGGVVKAAATKTLVVKVDHMRLNTKYNKYFRVSRSFHVHDEDGVGKVGDVITFRECRPISKTKKWRLIKALKNNK